MLRSIFGPWILENTWGIVFLVMRRCYSLILVGGFDSKLKFWMNQSLGRFLCYCAEQMGRRQSAPWLRMVRSRVSVNGRQSAFRKGTVRQCQIFQTWCWLTYFNVEWFYCLHNCSYGIFLISGHQERSRRPQLPRSKRPCPQKGKETVMTQMIWIMLQTPVT